MKLSKQVEKLEETAKLSEMPIFEGAPDQVDG